MTMRITFENYTPFSLSVAPQARGRRAMARRFDFSCCASYAQRERFSKIATA
jgi:hypothetical protein